LKALSLESAIREQSRSQAADANEDHRLQAVGAEAITDRSGEQFDIVPEAARAELPEIGQVFAELSRLDTGGFGERVTRNGADAIAFQSLQTTKVHGQPVDGFARYLVIFLQALVNEHQFVRQQ